MMRHLKRLDWIMILAVFFICILGILSIYSSSFARNNFINFQKQAIFLAIGFLIMIGLSFLDYRALKESSLFVLALYFIISLSLFLVYFFSEKIRGIHGWFNFGFVVFQPVEFMKISLILLMAKYFSMRHIEMYRPLHIVISGIYLVIPFLLVFFQPDFGSAAILLFLWLGVMIIAGIKIRHLLLLGILGVIIFFLAWNFALKPYQKERLISFINPYVDPVGQGYNVIQSTIAIGDGGIFGRGLGYGSQVQYKFLPEPQNDFIFAAISEEFGLVGVFILFFLMLIFLFRVIKIALVSQNNFAKIITSSFAFLIFLQVFINVGMNIGFLPIVGIPLPFLSYGGSNLLSLFIGLGIVQSIKVRM